MRNDKDTCTTLALLLFWFSAYFLFLTRMAIGNSYSHDWTDLYFIVPTVALIVASNFYAAMATIKGGSRLFCGLIIFAGNFAFTWPLGRMLPLSSIIVSMSVYLGSLFYQQYRAGRLTIPAQG